MFHKTRSTHSTKIFGAPKAKSRGTSASAVQGAIAIGREKVDHFRIVFVGHACMKHVQTSEIVSDLFVLFENGQRHTNKHNKMSNTAYATYINSIKTKAVCATTLTLAHVHVGAPRLVVG